jgi:hypothetical protein
MKNDDHIPTMRLASGALTADEQEHLAQCPRCRVEQRRTAEFFGPDTAGGAVHLPSPSLPGPDGRYVDLGHLSQGGMAEIRKVHDLLLDRVVAMKLLWPRREAGFESNAASPTLGPIDAFRDRFLREATVTSRLQHPAIVPIYDRGVRPDGALFYTMKYVRGATLEEKLAACATLRTRLALLGNFLVICQAVAYAHSQGVIHRDLKPKNVMIGEFGETVVLDWGIAKLTGEAELPVLLGEELHGQTEAGTVLGTPGYMSPEQALGYSEQVDARSDVWALGAMLFALLTGGPPFQGAPLSILSQMRQSPSPPVASRCPEAPADLAAVADKALSRDPSHRYQDAGELVAEIEAFLSGARVAVYPYSGRELLLRFVRAHRLAVGLLLLAGLGLVAAVALLLGLNGRLRLARDEQALLAAQSRQHLAQRVVSEGHAHMRAQEPLLALPRFTEALVQLEGQEGELSARARLLAALVVSPRLLALVPTPSAPFLREGRALALSGDGHVLAVASDTVELWDVDAYEPIARIPMRARKLAFAPDGRLAVLGDDGLSVWSPAGVLLAGPISGPMVRHEELMWAADGQLFRLDVSPPDLGAVTHPLQVPRCFVMEGSSLTPCPYPEGISPLSADMRWGLSRQRQDELTLRAQLLAMPGQSPVGQPLLLPAEGRVAFARSGARLALLNGPNTQLSVVELRADNDWELAVGEPSERWNSTEPLQWLAVSDDGERVAVGGGFSDVWASLLDRNGRVLSPRVTLEGSFAPSFALDGPGQRVAIAGREVVGVWEFPPEEPEAGLGGLLLSSPDGSRWRSRGGMVLQLDAISDEVMTRCALQAVEGQEEWKLLAVSPDGQWLISRGPEAAGIYACERGTGQSRLLSPRPYADVTFGPDGRLLVVHEGEGGVLLGSDLSTVLWQGRGSRFFLSPDGHRIAILSSPSSLEAARDGELWVHEVRSGAHRPVPLPPGSSRPAAPEGALGQGGVSWVDSERLAFTWGSRVHFVSLAEGGEAWPPIVHPPGAGSYGVDGAIVRDLRVDPQGQWVTTGDWAGRRRAWALPGGAPLGPWVTLGSLGGARVDARGPWLVAGGWLELHQTSQVSVADLHLFELSTGSWVASMSCGLGDDCLSIPSAFAALDDGGRSVTDWVQIIEALSGQQVSVVPGRLPPAEWAERLRDVRARYPEL